MTQTPTQNHEGPDLIAIFRARSAQRDWEKVHIEGDARASAGMYGYKRVSFLGRVLRGLVG